jgi:intein/homing endonuclease
MNLENFKNKMELLAEEVGIHIGDGSMNFYLNNGKWRGLFQLRGHLRDDREYYVDYLKRFYYKLFGIRVSIREMKSDGVLGFQLWSDELVNFKKSLGLPLGKKRNIKIPYIFLKNKKLKISVLRGIFDTDGCIYLEKKRGKLYPRVEFRTTSFPLAKQIIKILDSIGIHATLYSVKRKNKNWQDLMCINVRGFKQVKKFFKLVKPHNPKHNTKFKRLLTNGEADNRKVGSSNLPRPTQGPIA